MFYRGLAAVAAAFVASAPAGAATISIDQVVTWHSFAPYALIDMSPVAYQAGDTIQLTLDFGATAHFSGYTLPGYFSGVVLANPSNNGIYNPGSATYQLLNATGDFAPSGVGHITQGIGYLPLPIGSPTVAMTGSFDGIQITYQVTGNVQGLDQRLSRIQFGLAPFQAQPVPEPATWAMMLLGFGAMGMAARRRSLRRPRGTAG